MNTPFTQSQFFDVFTAYNTSVWPVQIFFNLLALLVIFFAVKKYTYSDKLITFTLSFLWLWIGIIYHIIFFSTINPAAYGFGVLFVIQGLLFIYTGAVKKSLSFYYKSGSLHITGIVLILYALIIYPLLGSILGHSYPAAPTFGLPCPTVIFTFGMLLWSKDFPKYLLIIPFIWSVIGFFAAIKFGVLEDTGLLLAGIIGTLVLALRKSSNKK